jgi:uncharacterized membrane protein YgdD (TMEM256/DUF423 family)
MQKIIVIVGACMGALGVGLGAFGAHAFKSILEANQRIDTFETAVKYHFIHVLAILITALLMDKYSEKMLSYSAYGFIGGIILFSGALYALSLTGNTKWGAVAPIGGLALIAGWILMIIAAWRS